MENKKISELDELTQVTGDEILPVVSDKQNYRVTVKDLVDGAQDYATDEDIDSIFTDETA